MRTMTSTNQTEFNDWLNGLSKFLADHDASSTKKPKKVTTVTRESNSLSLHLSGLLRNKQSKTYPVDRLNEILEKQRLHR